MPTKKKSAEVSPTNDIATAIGYEFGDTNNTFTVSVPFDVSGLFITINNPSFSPGCGGFLGFEVNFKNDTDNDQTIYIWPTGGFQAPHISYSEGHSTQECYQYDSPDERAEFHVKSGESATYAIRIMDNPDPLESLFVFFFENEINKLGVWRIDKTVTTVSEATQVLASPTPLQAKTPETTGCKASEWKIIPLSVQYFPSTLQGWKYLVMKYAIANESDTWGEWADGVINSHFSYLVSEDGFAYPPLESPEYSSFAREMGELGITDFPNWPQPFFLFSDPIPSGFFLSGEYDSYLGDYYSAAFRVAETQNHFKLITKPLYIICRGPDGKRIYPNTGQDLIVDLERDLRTPSNPLSASSVRSISEPIEIQNFGTFNILGLTNSTEQPGLLLNIKFTNANMGYQAEGDIDSYLITSDGLTIRDQGYFSAGPGQSIEFSLLFDNAPARDDYYVVIYSLVNLPVTLVYDLTR
jgi:hypothetical protein